MLKHLVLVMPKKKKKKNLRSLLRMTIDLSVIFLTKDQQNVSSLKQEYLIKQIGNGTLLLLRPSHADCSDGQWLILN